MCITQHTSIIYPSTINSIYIYIHKYIYRHITVRAAIVRRTTNQQDIYHAIYIYVYICIYTYKYMYVYVCRYIFMVIFTTGDWVMISHEILSNIMGYMSIYIYCSQYPSIRWRWSRQLPSIILPLHRLISLDLNLGNFFLHTR